MPYQSLILTAMKRTALVLLCLSLAGANTLAGTNATQPGNRKSCHVQTGALHPAVSGGRSSPGCRNCGCAEF